MYTPTSDISLYFSKSTQRTNLRGIYTYILNKRRYIIYKTPYFINSCQFFLRKKSRKIISLKREITKKVKPNKRKSFFYTLINVNNLFI